MTGARKRNLAKLNSIGQSHVPLCPVAPALPKPKVAF